jgi:hypothetical protein
MTNERLDRIALMPWVVRLPKKGTVVRDMYGEARQVTVHACEEFCYGRMPLYAGYVMSVREERIKRALDAGEPISEEDQQYWDACREKSAKAREKGRCRLNAGWLYVDVYGDVHYLCTHHLDSYLADRDYTRAHAWWSQLVGTPS